MQSFAQACSFKFATLKWFTPVPRLGPEFCHDRGPALPRPWDCVGVTTGGTGSLLCFGFGTASGIWQACESTPVADIAVNRHQSSISSLESLGTSKYPQLCTRGRVQHTNHATRYNTGN